jgi:uncharacterized membrane protein
VSAVSFVVSGLLIGVMIGISWYGARTLPADARIPLHYGPGGYGSFASKKTGLVVWPFAGAVIFVLLVGVSESVIKPNHGSNGTALIILPIVLVALIAAQWGAISRARSDTTVRSDQ